jgi:hypothetical protein
MGLAERLSQEPVLHQSRCSVGRLLDDLSEIESVALQDAIDKIRSTSGDSRKTRRHPYTVAWLTEQLVAEGYDFKRQTISRHVVGSCSCGS